MRVTGIRRDLVESQIAAAFPDADRTWVTATCSACYGHFGRELAETARVFEFGLESFSTPLELEPRSESLIARMQSGAGMVIVTGHLGNWEVAGAYLASLGVPLAAVVREQSNRRVDRWVQDSRRRLGLDPIYPGDLANVAPGLLRSGKSIVLVADHYAGSRGDIVTFLGREAWTFRGPARLALATGTPLVYGSMVLRDQAYRMAVEVCDVPERLESEPVRVRERGLTEAWVRLLESRVREAPEQYLWFHRRWKSAVTD